MQPKIPEIRIEQTKKIKHNERTKSYLTPGNLPPLLECFLRMPRTRRNHQIVAWGKEIPLFNKKRKKDYSLNNWSLIEHEEMLSTRVCGSSTKLKSSSVKKNLQQWIYASWYYLTTRYRVLIDTLTATQPIPPPLIEHIISYADILKKEKKIPDVMCSAW